MIDNTKRDADERQTITDPKVKKEGKKVKQAEQMEKDEQEKQTGHTGKKEEKKDKKKTSSVEQKNDISDNSEGSWYVVHTQSGFEKKAKEALEQRIKTLELKKKIFDIVIPMRDIVIIKKGEKKNVKEKVFPGYLLIKMTMDDDSWLVVRTTQGITGFVGAGTKPTPISDKEVEAIKKFVTQEQPKFRAKFSVGEAIKVTDGPFSDFIGTIESIDDAKGKVKVLVSIFGRETPVELDFLQVSKL